MRVLGGQLVALFQDLRDLGFDHLQYANTEGEKVWEILSHAVMSGRQRSEGRFTGGS